MTRPTIIHISVIPSVITLFTEHRQAALERIFGQEVAVVPMLPRGTTPALLVQRVRELRPDAVVLSTAPPEHRQAVEELAGETVILYPVHERARNARAEMEDHFAGFGVMREHGPELVVDGALADRSAVVEELAIQRSLRRERDERER